MQPGKSLQRLYSTTRALFVRTSRAKQPLSLRNKDAVATSNPSSFARNKQQNAPAVQPSASSQPPQQYYQPAPAPSLGQTIMDGFSFGIGSAIARQMVDSMWPGGGMGGGLADGGSGGGQSPAGDSSANTQPPPAPPTDAYDQTEYSEDPYASSGGDGGDDGEEW